MQKRRWSWSAVRAWISCRVQASFRVPSVTLEWAATASSAMAASTGMHKKCSGLKRLTKDPDYRCTWCQGTACPLDSRPQREVQVGPDKLKVVASFCYLGDMLSAAGGCELSTTTCVKTAWKKFKELLPVLSSRHLAFKTCGRVYSSCVQSAMLHASETWPLTKLNVCNGMTGQWSDRSAMSGRKTLSPPGPMSYLCGLALRIWTSFWRREGSAGMDMWSAPMVQSRQPFTYRLRESMDLGGQRWHGSSWQRGIAESGSSRLSTLMIEICGDLVWDLPCVQQASYLEGGPLMSMLPLYLQVNQKSDYDMMIPLSAKYLKYCWSQSLITNRLVVMRRKLEGPIASGHE